MKTPVKLDFGVVAPTGELEPGVGVARLERFDEVLAGCGTVSMSGKCAGSGTATISMSTHVRYHTARYNREMAANQYAFRP
jgi:hypothetical protein